MLPALSSCANSLDSMIPRILDRVQTEPTSSGPASDRPLPRLSARDIVAAEDLIGVRLPDLVKRLYMEVGNGGFGPGFGLLPLVQTADVPEGRFAVDCYAQFRQSRDWHTSVLPFSSWGCGVISCLDLIGDDDPAVYRFEPNMPDGYTVDYLHGLPYRGAGLIPERMRLSQWLEEWLSGRAEELFQRMNAI